MTIKNILFLLCMVSVYSFGYGQSTAIFQTENANAYRYYIVNSKEQNFPTHKVEVSSANFFNCDNHIYKAELYNVHISAYHFILFTILPSASDYSPRWEKIDLKTVDKNLITPKQLSELAEANLNNYARSGYKMTRSIKMSNIKLIIAKPDGYYINKSDCLSELFIETSIRPSKGFSNENPLNCLDISNTPLTTAEFEAQYFRRNGNNSYNNTYAEESSVQGYGFNTPTLFYSHSFQILNYKSYFFWTLDNWIADGLNLNRGIDRLIYTPGIGIIGGDYTFFFKKLQKTYRSPACEKINWYRYLNNEVELMPINITKNIEKS